MSLIEPRIIAIVLARGGSKGIPGKNIIDFCGKPLLSWTIEQCAAAKSVTEVWVSSDSSDILDVASQYGAQTLVRPHDISGDHATSESGWLHALDYIEGKTGAIDLVLAPQVTSPLRESSDIQKAIDQFIIEGCDSMFSCCVAEDLFFWKRDNNGLLQSVNYDHQTRKRRQDIPKQFVENGSFYIFKPSVIRKNNNRFGGKIGCVEMEFWKMFEIDGPDDAIMCSALMKEFLLESS